MNLEIGFPTRELSEDTFKPWQLPLDEGCEEVMQKVQCPPISLLLTSPEPIPPCLSQNESE